MTILREWISSTNQGWFEGLASGYPSTNNALESTNNVIIMIHTLKERVPLSQFLERLKIILNRWSVDLVERVKFEFEPRMEDELWKNTLDYITYYNIDCDEYCLLNGCESLDSLDFTKFVEKNESVRMVKFNKENWKLSSCTCSTYLKEFLCKHILIIALSLKLTEIPEKFRDSVIGCKPKPGKKKKAKNWFDRE
ncbi:unnamed protein product [Brachionus calyciflorus]|uniref:SWIM-type domain-containing protein n=1 Tax=Brachionus calyciflorus TaxID=104777 RepID=A0A814QGT7_9BILA|nr:unnamed protein product [Brachionus calyciflorus]